MGIKIIDSHCHLPTDIKQTAVILENAAAEDVVAVVNIGTSLEDSKEAQELNKTFPNAYYTVGVYPHENPNLSTQEIKLALQTLIDADNKPVAIGECGIDIQENGPTTPLERQVELFTTQIDLAVSNKLPLIIHNRGGDETILDLLSKRYSKSISTGDLKAVVHCFSSDVSVAKQFINLGLYLSFTGMITYQTKSYVLDVIKAVPSDKYMIETDAPYLTPNPYRKEKNESKYVKIVAQKVADTLNQPFDQVCLQTYKNTATFFNLP